MGLLDFAQGASNAVASNVSAPVDGLAWLLKKLGVPVGPAPVGGSDWMANAGLTRPAPGVSGLLGETAGLLAPMTAAAKAPQLAHGLLTMGENAAARQTLNPQKGAVVWHGSPHKFDKFDSSKIGTGEGAQAYGHGLYLAESDDVARRYRDTLTNFRPDHIEAKLVEAGISPEMANTYAQFSAQTKGGPRAFDDFVKMANETSPSPYIESFRQRLRSELPNTRQALDSISGSLYKVDLPDEAIGRMLDWDKPLSQQPKALRDALDESQWKALESAAKKAGMDVFDYEKSILGSRNYPPAPTGTGEEYWQALGNYLGSRDKASQVMREAGIPGIRYLDAGSRGAGTGTSNYVVFPGEEDILRILERIGGR
jgi:hypothetical protein